MDKVLLIIGLGLVVVIVLTGGFGAASSLGLSAPSLSFFGSGGPLASGSGTKDFSSSSVSVPDSTESSPASQKRGTVKIESVSRADSSRPQDEYVVIRYESSSGAAIAVSSWSVGNTLGNRFTLGFAEPIATNSALETVKLRPGDEVYIHTGASPLGVGFRENTCTGYFNQNHSFDPTLSESCPRPDTSRLTQFNDACLRFLDRAQTCRTLDITGEGSIGIGSACTDYINSHFSYTSCVADERGKSGFLKPVWHLYLNRPSAIWRSFHDRITLYDEFGQVVDTYNY